MSTLSSSTWTSIEQQAATLATTLFKGYATQASQDAKDFLTATEGQIADWLTQLQNGDITQKNFSSLVLGESDLVALNALKEAGLAQASLDAFTSGLLQIVINAAIAAIP